MHAVWLPWFTHRTPLIALMCTFWRQAWCFRSHGTLMRRIKRKMCWNLWRRNWISVRNDGSCSVPFNYTVWLAQTVSKYNRDLRMSSQVISETCGIVMYKGGGRFASGFRLGETLVFDDKPPVTVSILRMVDKAFHLVITTFDPPFRKPFGGPKKGLDPALLARNLRLRTVSAHLELPIHIHTHLKIVVPDSRHDFKGTFQQVEELGVSILGSFALVEPNTVSFFGILWFFSALVGNAPQTCLKFLNDALGLFFTNLNLVKKC